MMPSHLSGTCETILVVDDNESIRKLQMERTLLSSQEILAWITAKLSEIEGCQTLKVHGLKRLEAPNETGCNWSSDVWVRGLAEESLASWVEGRSWELEVKTLVDEARSRFNLKS